MKNITSIFVSGIPAVAMAIASLLVPFIIGMQQAVAVHTKQPEIVSYQVEPFEDFPILPNSHLLNKAPSKELRVEGCAGERVHVSFVLLARNNNFEDLELVRGNLLDSSNVIDSKIIDVKVVKPWFQSAPIKGKRNYHTRAKKRERRLVPELLLHDDSLVKIDMQSEHNYIKLKWKHGNEYRDISQEGNLKKVVILKASEFPVQDAKEFLPFNLRSGEYKQLFLTLSLPQDAVPGVYSGPLYIQDHSGRNILNLPLQLRILDFKLNESPLLYSIYYRSKLHDGEGTISSEWKNELQLRQELRDLVDKGVNPTAYQPLNNQRLFKSYMRLRQQMGAVGNELFILSRQTSAGMSQRSLSVLTKDVEWLKTNIPDYGFKVPYVYGKDEAKGDEINKQQAAWYVVQQAGGKNFSAGYRGHFRRSKGLTDLLVLHGTPNKEEITIAHSFGSKILSYSNPQAGADVPLLFRVNYGVNLWRSDMDGAMPYAYQHSMGFIWNDFDHHKYKDHALVYPTIDGIISTLSWEAFGEAITDTRYIQTLTSLLKKHGSTLPVKLKQRGDDILASIMYSTKLSPSAMRSSIASLLQDAQKYVGTDKQRIHNDAE